MTKELYSEREYIWFMKYFLFFILLPLNSHGQDSLFAYLKIGIKLNQQIDSLKCKYSGNSNDKDGLLIPFRTTYRFYPESTDTVKSFNFNIDSSGKVCSIVIISPVDSAYLSDLILVLGPPNHKIRFGYSIKGENDWTYYWTDGMAHIIFSSYGVHSYMVVFNRNGKTSDYLKWDFKNK